MEVVEEQEVRNDVFLVKSVTIKSTKDLVIMLESLAARFMDFKVIVNNQWLKSVYTNYIKPIYEVEDCNISVDLLRNYPFKSIKHLETYLVDLAERLNYSKGSVKVKQITRIFEDSAFDFNDSFYFEVGFVIKVD